MTINPALPIETIRRELARSRVVAIPDFLTAPAAARLQEFYAETMPRHWWTVALRAGRAQTSFRDTLENTPAIALEYERACRAFRAGQFSYCFRRTRADHVPQCACVECELRGFLQSGPMLGFLQALGIPAQTTGDVFASCYLPGSFLSPHHDKDNGRIGFILNLSRDWRPQFGGNLHFLKDDWKTVERVFTPTYNTLILFDIPSHNGVPHFVSHVAAGKRLAVGGWYG